ncbi:hypothetical protein ES707_19836 [subsurface metagenome]
MNEFIEKNRRLLNFYYIAARTIAWLLLIVALVIAVVRLLSGFGVDDQFRFLMIYRLCQQLAVSYVLLGLVLLVLAQFLRYLYENDYQPGWILRHGNKVLYLYAAALIIGPILGYYFRMKAIGHAGTDSLHLYLLSSLLPAVAKALIFIGIAKILKRMMPMVGESKTLV